MKSDFYIAFQPSKGSQRRFTIKSVTSINTHIHTLNNDDDNNISYNNNNNDTNHWHDVHHK